MPKGYPKNGINTGRFKKGSAGFTGRHTEETKQKMSLSKKGLTSPRKGTTLSKETKLKLSRAHTGKKYPNRKPTSTETRKKQSEAKIGIKWPREVIKRRLRIREMSSLEEKMMDIITDIKLPYRFVGNGEFFIENKCPDFINCNGEKIAIEVFYSKHKEQFRRGGLNNWMRQREKIFAKYGWKIVFLSETEVYEDVVKERLKLGKDPGL